MVQQQLIDYVKGQLKQGYSSTQIKSALLSAGYSSSDVEEALHAAGTKHVTTGILVIAFISILVIIIGIIVVLHATSEPPAELDASVSLFTSDAAPGGDLVFSVIITNTGGATNGLVDAALTTQGREIARTTLDFSVTDQVTLPVTLQVPTDASLGDAVITATVNWGVRSKTTRENVRIRSASEEPINAPIAPIETITPSAPLEEARASQQTCSTTCDDLNFCTTDSCVAGKCVNTELVPCCGNRACESGESESSCAVDCAEEQPNPDAVTSTAMLQAANDFPSALRACQSLGQQNHVDLCLTDVSGAGKNKQGCAEISSVDLRDGCYVQFAYSGDAEACTHVENPSLLGSCEQLVRLAQMQKEYGAT